MYPSFSFKHNTASLQHIIMMFQKCAQWSEKECLADDLGFKQRRHICEKMIRIAYECLQLGNFPIGIALISGLGPGHTPSSLWEEVPEKWRRFHKNYNNLLVNSPIEGYKQEKRRFKGKFHIPALVPTLKAFDLKVNCQPTFHKTVPTLIHFKKFVVLHDTIADFLEPQQLVCSLKPNHALQWAIAYRMSRWGRVVSTGATTAERSNMAQRKKVAEQIETEAVAKKLSYLGF